MVSYNISINKHNLKMKTGNNLSPLLEDIELSQNGLNNNTFDIYFDFENQRFHAFENDVPKSLEREFVYELTDSEEKISKEHREEILDYCLSRYTDEDSVGLGDIFVHGKYIKQVIL